MEKNKEVEEITRKASKRVDDAERLAKETVEKKTREEENKTRMALMTYQQDQVRQASHIAGANVQAQHQEHIIQNMAAQHANLHHAALQQE